MKIKAAESGQVAGIISGYKTYVLFFVLILALYGNSIKNEYCLDDEMVVNNDISKKGIKAIPEIFTTHYYSDPKNNYGYRPLAKASFALEYSLFRTNPHISHFINLLLYWGGCCLLMLLLKNLFKSVSDIIPFIVVLLFIFHPLHTEVVSSLKNREVLLSFIGSISAFIFFLEFAGNRKWKYLFLGMMALVFAALAKEDSLIYFIIIPFTLIYFKRIAKAELIRLLGGLFFLILLSQFFQSIVQSGFKHEVLFYENPLFTDHSFAHRISMGFYSLARYTKLLIVPYPLVSYYGYNAVPVLDLHDWRVCVSALVFIGLSGYCFFYFRKRSLLVFGVLFMLISISVFLNIVTPVAGIIAERHAFNCSLGFCIVITVLLFKVFRMESEDFENQFNIRFFKANRLFTFALGTILLFYSGLVISRNTEWKNLYTLTQADIQAAPNSVQLSRLAGDAIMKKWNDPKINPGERDSIMKNAINIYKNSLRIYPDQPTVLNNLGIIYSWAYKDYNEAITYFKQAIKADSSAADYYQNAGCAYTALNRQKEALICYTKAISLDSMYTKAYTPASDTYLVLNRLDDALQLNLAGIRNGANRTYNAYLVAGDLYLLRKDTANAVANYGLAVALNHQNVELCRKIIAYYEHRGDTEKARFYEKLISAQ